MGITQRTLVEYPDTLLLADETLGKAIQEVRSLSKSLNREWLEQFNFMENLEAEITRINAAKTIQIQLSRPELLSLKADKQIILFRIVQEILQNAIKHSGAKHLTIRIQEEGAKISIAVADDGKGFDEAGVQKSVGILNIKHRSHLLGGSAQWQSAIGNGTRVTIQIPVNPVTL